MRETVPAEIWIWERTPAVSTGDAWEGESLCSGQMWSVGSNFIKVIFRRSPKCRGVRSTFFIEHKVKSQLSVPRCSSGSLLTPKGIVLTWVLVCSNSQGEILTGEILQNRTSFKLIIAVYMFSLNDHEKS